MSRQGKGVRKRVPGPVTQAPSIKKKRSTLVNITTAFIFGESRLTINEKYRKLVFVVHAPEDQEYAETVCKYLDNNGFITILSGHDYHPLGSHEKGIYESILMTDKTLFLVTSSSKQLFIETIQKVKSKSPAQKTFLSVLLSSMNEHEERHFKERVGGFMTDPKDFFSNKRSSRRMFGNLQMNITRLADTRIFQEDIADGYSRGGPQSPSEFDYFFGFIKK